MKFNESKAGNRETGHRLIAEARACWDAMKAFRRDRRRNKRYTYGDQWGDLVNVDGIDMTEEEYIRSQGNIPLKNNLIRRLVRNVVGVYRNGWKEPEWPLDGKGGDKAKLRDLLLRSCRENDAAEIYARTFEEFLISGVAIHRKSVRRRGACLTRIVQPDKFFIDSDMSDVRSLDASIIGEIHDIGFEDVCRMFATSAQDCEKLGALYHFSEGLTGWNREFGSERDVSDDFLTPVKGDKCRVVEVWRHENRSMYYCHDRLTGRLYKVKACDWNSIIGRENERRHRRGMSEDAMIRGKWRMERVWRYYYLTPEGEILRCGETPYAHGEHPYVFRAYPFVDGEIHSFVSDVIDQQRYANRLITLYDWVMRASAKGVLLFPEDCLPPGVDIDNISSEWSRFNGVILFRPKPDVPLPQQVSANTSNIGITELLNIQLKLLEDISGVNGALQGNVASNSMSGKLFNAQTENALTALGDILASFRAFERAATKKEALLLASAAALQAPAESAALQASLKLEADKPSLKLGPFQKLEALPETEV